MLAKVDELRTWIVRMQFDLVDRRYHLAGRIGKEMLEVLDTEIGYSNTANFVFWQFL